jgi:hypothetical protein
MTIQFNTDNNVKGSKELTSPLIEYISEQFSRYAQQISRLDVHLSDENGLKRGPDDKRCMLEAKIEGRRPIAVVGRANSYRQAVTGATEKLISSMEKITG